MLLSDPIVYDSHLITRKLLYEWRGKITNEDLLASSTLRFAHAWVGAIQMAGVPVVYQFEDLKYFLWHFNHNLSPEEYTADKLKLSNLIRRLR